jgi:flagellar hook assembly protein FlgD
MEFSVPAAGHVTLKVYDLQGRVVRTLIEQDAAPGTFSSTWDGLTDEGGSAGRGVYFLRFTAGAQSVERKVVLQ